MAAERYAEGAATRWGMLMIMFSVLLLAASTCFAADAPPTTTTAADITVATPVIDLRRNQQSNLQRQLQIATGSGSAMFGSRLRASFPLTMAAAASDEIFWDGFDLCGNGAIDAPEQCDRADLGAATCSSLGYTSGTLACDQTCHYDVSQCVVSCLVLLCGVDVDCGSAACGPCLQVGSSGVCAGYNGN
jgi:hypothetical protein